MSKIDEREYWVPEHVRDCLRSLGFTLPLEAMERFIREWQPGCPQPGNTRVDMSLYGQSVFADAVDAIQAVDVAFDALINEVSVSRMRIFLSDVLFDKDTDGSGKKVTISFGKNDCTVFRKVMSTEVSPIWTCSTARPRCSPSWVSCFIARGDLPCGGSGVKTADAKPAAPNFVKRQPR